MHDLLAMLQAPATLLVLALIVTLTTVFEDRPAK